MWLYNIALIIYGWLIRLAGRSDKAKRWRAGRANLFARMEAAIGPSERIVWVHAASLGEFEQGRPLIERIRREHPAYKILLTFFSPSGYDIRKNYEGADYIFCLPLDTRRNARRFLDIVRPEIAIFIKYEFWLNLLRELRRRRVRTFIVSAIFRRNSVFFRFYGGMWREALESFETIFVQNETSKRLLANLGFDNVIVSGDTRFDRVADIARAARHLPLIEAFRGDRRLFVAGSTWGPDEELLIRLINDNPTVKFIVAPHEMDEQRIGRLLGAVRGGALRYTQAAADETVARELPAKQLLVIDTVGLLSSIYGYAAWSYIGGGFGVGIHNTLEAATFGLPIAFGPNYRKFKEACDLVTLGAATPITSGEELAAWFAPLLNDETARERAGRAAREYTRNHQGATEMIERTIFQ